MKRCFLFAVILIVLPFFSLFTAGASTENEIILQQEDAAGIAQATESLPEEVVENLDKLGIDPEHPTEGMKKFTISDLFKELSGYISEAVSPAISSLAMILGVIFLSSVFSSEKNRVLHSVAIAAVGAAIITPVLSFLNYAVGAISDCSAFITSMLPVFASFMLSSGLTISSASLTGSILILSRSITRLASSVFLPLICSGLSLSAVGAFVPEIKTESIASSIRKIAIWAVGALLLIYLTFLGIQSGITSSLDGLANKTAKLTVSSAIPIVGSIISDASDTVFGAAQVIRSGIGGFSFVVIALIFVKPLLAGIAWLLTLRLASFAASSFGRDEVARLTGAVEKSISVIISLLAASAVALIISIAIIVKLRM